MRYETRESLEAALIWKFINLLVYEYCTQSFQLGAASRDVHETMLFVFNSWKILREISFLKAT